MPSTVGMRVYRLTVRKRGKADPVAIESPDLSVNIPLLIEQLIESHTENIKQDSVLERGWYFDEKEKEELGNSNGYIRYGTYGFESDLVDGKTQEKKYKRTSMDLEIIPLYYSFFSPIGRNFSLLAFQSFRGRSCITLVLSALRVLFEKNNPGFIIVFENLVPSAANIGIYNSSPVKRLRLIQKNENSDIADSYLNYGTTEEIDVELVLSAKRNKSLGLFGEVCLSLSEKSVGGMIGYDSELQFSEAVAEIKVGNKTRRIAAFGLNKDIGIIDLTDSIVKGPDGHPTLDSIREQFNEIIESFFKKISGREK